MSAAARSTRSLALGTLALAFAGLASAAQPKTSAADGIADANAQAFLTSLQTAVRSDDRRRVAKLVHYPLRVNRATAASAGGAAPTPRNVENAAAFVQGYGTIFTPKVREAVLRQDPAKLFRNAQGAMIGNGEVWFAGVCRTPGCAHPVLGITAVNVPR